MNKKMCVDIDIEIREITSGHDTFFKVIVYEVETVPGKDQIRTVQDIYHANDYTTAVNLLQEFLNKA